MSCATLRSTLLSLMICSTVGTLPPASAGEDAGGADISCFAHVRAMRRQSSSGLPVFVAQPCRSNQSKNRCGSMGRRSAWMKAVTSSNVGRSDGCPFSSSPAVDELSISISNSSSLPEFWAPSRRPVFSRGSGVPTGGARLGAHGQGWAAHLGAQVGTFLGRGGHP